MHNELNAISPLDGRYKKVLAPLQGIVSEAGLIRYRIQIECAYVEALLSIKEVGGKSLSAPEKALLREIADTTDEDVALVKKIETIGHESIPATNHDVKAVEHFLRLRFKGTALAERTEWIHFALTSEDINNLSYALLIRDALHEALLPAYSDVHRVLVTLAETHAGVAMLSRTHGQSASPTTFGKEMRVFAERLERQIVALSHFEILAKCNGATGNFNAHVAAYPSIDWEVFSKKFIKSFNVRPYSITLQPNLYTTQIESHDTYAELFDTIRRANTILIDFSQDMWRYISDGYVIQKKVAGEVGSSTMPHKVNPIDYENAEGNFGLANALTQFFSQKLPVSRLQRDLSDSTVERNFGSQFAYTLLALTSLQKGLSKISVNSDQIRNDLVAHPEVLAEAIQTILRREGVEDPYTLLKELTRGEKITQKDIEVFVNNLPIADSVKEELLKLNPETYIGLSKKLAESNS